MDNSTISNYLQGKCLQMCPEAEIAMRKKERLVHMFEMMPATTGKNELVALADPNKMVKCFSRSAAGKAMQNECNLRPPDVLLKTINYLLEDILVLKSNLSWNVKYDFIMDRLRSVRQDMVIQNVSRAQCISILQPIVRFHAYASYKLCEENINVFNSFINKTHLQECLKRLLCIYDDCDEYFMRKSGTRELNHYSEFLSQTRPEFEALYLVLNLGNRTALRRALVLPKIWRTSLVREVSELSRSYLKCNFIKVCRTIKKIPTLLLAVASLHMPEIRRQVLQTMSIAYNSKNLTYPLQNLADLLLYDSITSTISDCKYYGIDVRGEAVCFNKKEFKGNIECVGPKKEHFVEEMLEGVSETSLLLFGI